MLTIRDNRYAYITRDVTFVCAGKMDTFVIFLYGDFCLLSSFFRLGGFHVWRWRSGCFGLKTAFVMVIFPLVCRYASISVPLKVR